LASIKVNLKCEVNRQGSNTVPNRDSFKAEVNKDRPARPVSEGFFLSAGQSLVSVLIFSLFGKLALLLALE